MKKFILITTGLMLLAILIAALVFWYISSNYNLSSKSAGVDLNTSKTIGVGDSEKSSSTETNKIAPTLPDEFKQGVPVNQFNLSDAQKSTLKKAGVDVETYVLTPEQISCFILKLGEQRFNEIVAGDSLGMFDTAKIMPCVQ